MIDSDSWHLQFVIPIPSTTGMERFVEEELQPKLNTYLLGIRLDGVASVFREYQHGIEEGDRRLEEAALTFLLKDWTPQDDTLKKERGKLQIKGFPV